MAVSKKPACAARHAAYPCPIARQPNAAPALACSLPSAAELTEEEEEEEEDGDIDDEGDGDLGEGMGARLGQPTVCGRHAWGAVLM